MPRHTSEKNLKFIDLFAGLGGFHIALKALGHECVFASEIDPMLSDLYTKNYKLEPFGDIRKIDLKEIPDHDILCAGFPCQPFSKSGKQLGFDCSESGDLFQEIVKILRKKKPPLFIIENVANLIKHNNGNTFSNIVKKLKNMGYDVDFKVLSPHSFGIPQIRERVFIVGSNSKCGLRNFEWPNKENESAKLSIKDILDKKPKSALKLNSQFQKYLKTWQNFLDAFPPQIELPSFPIWAMEFGATYPYQARTPYSFKFKGLGKYKGSFGKSLKNLSIEQIQNVLPPYAREPKDKFPEWKIRFIQQNREFYQTYKKIIDPWLPEIIDFPASFQKFEWNCKGENRDIRKFIIQFRASGIRVKRPTTAPSLVAMTTSQIPVIGWENRYMTDRECSRLQGMKNIELPMTKTRSHKALGNAVNTTVVKKIMEELAKCK